MKNNQDVIIFTDSISLDKFLKWAGVAETGGTAKYLIQNESVYVNDILEKRRSRLLYDGDLVCVQELCFNVKHQRQD